MKKLFLLLLICPFFLTCSDSDDKDDTQDYTSVIVVCNSADPIENGTVAFLQPDGIFKHIADIGNITNGKSSSEFKISNEITEIYLFTDAGSDTFIFLNPFKITARKRNTLTITSVDFRNVRRVDKSDNTQYPVH